MSQEKGIVPRYPDDRGFVPAEYTGENDAIDIPANQENVGKGISNEVYLRPNDGRRNGRGKRVRV